MSVSVSKCHLCVSAACHAVPDQFIIQKVHLCEERRRREWTRRRGEFLPDPAPVCDCCCWAARLDVTCVCVGGNAEQVREEEPWQERMKEGGISGGGRGRDRVKTNRIKKNKVVAVAIKNFYAQWVQWSLWGVLNEHRAASNEIPTENRGAIQTDS